MNTISQPFEEFVKRIIITSELRISDGMLPLAFDQELIIQKEAVKVFFQTIFTIYDEWMGSTYSTFISEFIHSEGLSVFSVWLAEVFPFNFDRIEIECPKGPSTEDVLMIISYNYNASELTILQNSIQEYNLTVDAESLAKLLLTEAIKSISKILSEAIEDDYKIFTQEVTAQSMDSNLFIKFRGAGRVVK